MHLSKVLITSLLLVAVTGAVFFCVTSATLPTDHAMNNMPSNQNAFDAHIAYIQELTGVMIGGHASFATMIFLLLSIVVALVLASVDVLFAESQHFSYFWKRSLGIYRAARFTVVSWFARLVRGPNVLQLA